MVIHHTIIEILIQGALRKYIVNPNLQSNGGLIEKRTQHFLVRVHHNLSLLQILKDTEL